MAVFASTARRYRSSLLVLPFSFEEARQKKENHALRGASVRVMTSTIGMKKIYTP